VIFTIQPRYTCAARDAGDGLDRIDRCDIGTPTPTRDAAVRWQPGPNPAALKRAAA
jgi:hypothetical protein